VTKEMLGLVAAALGVMAGYIWKSFDVAVERSRRNWDTRQKILFRMHDAGDSLHRGAVETINDPSNGVRTDVHVAILQLQSLGAGPGLIGAGEAILSALAETEPFDPKQVGKLLSDFADELHNESVRMAKS
jgi:hypothetical protein